MPKYFVWNYADGSPCVVVEQQGDGEFLVPVELRSTDMPQAGTLTPLVALTPEVREAIEQLRALVVVYLAMTGDDDSASQQYKKAARIVRAWLDQEAQQ